MKSFLALLFIPLIISSCRNSGEKKSQMIVINVAESFSQKHEISLSKFVDNVLYVPLETKPEILLAQTARFEVTDDFIIVKNVGLGVDTQILLFDRNTGKFLREIGKQGRGPGEYNRISFLPYNSLKEEIYARGASGEIIIYDTFGKYLDKFDYPQWIDDKAPNEFWSRKSCRPQAMLDQDTFVGYVNNSSGWEERKIVLFTKNNIIKIFPNYQSFTRQEWSTITVVAGSPGKFYRWDGNLYFIEHFCDTLYRVNRESLAPKVYFDCGKYKALISNKMEILRRDNFPKYFFISDIDENSNYIFIRLNYNMETYTGFVEKNSNEMTFCKMNSSSISGLKDDINGLMDIIPKDFTQNNEMVYIIQPVTLMAWLKENPEVANQARNTLPWLTSIDEFSNPVIAIAKCKE